MFDAYKLFGIFTLVFTFFFIVVVGSDVPPYVFYIGLPYALILIFHKRLERLVSKIKKPFLWFGVLTFLGGILIEFLAYKTSVYLIAQGQNPVVFCPDSLACDLALFGIPHYLLITYGFIWTLKRYDFSVFKFGLTIFLFWAVVVDQFSHFIGLFGGGIPGVIGFVQAGLLLVFAFHGPYIIFEKRIREKFPQRSLSMKKYAPMILFQAGSILLVFVIAVIRQILI